MTFLICCLLLYLIIHVISDCLALYIWYLKRKINKLQEEGAKAFIAHYKQVSNTNPQAVFEFGIPGWRLVLPITKALKYGWVLERTRGEHK